MKKTSEFLSAIKQMFTKRFFRLTATLSSALLLLSVIVPAWLLLPEIREQVAIPLHYNIHFGVDWYGAWWRIFTIPVIGIVIFILNFVLSGIMWKKDKVLSYLLWTATIVSEVILLIAMTFIVLLNLAYI